MWPHELGPSGHQQLLFAAQVGLQAAISRMESNKIVQKTYWRWWGLDSKWCSIAFYYSFVSGHPKTHHCWWAKVCVVNRHRQDSSTENIKKNTLSNANEMPWNAPSSHEIQWCNIDMTSSEHHIYIYMKHPLPSMIESAPITITITMATSKVLSICTDRARSPSAPWRSARSSGSRLWRLGRRWTNYLHRRKTPGGNCRAGWGYLDVLDMLDLDDLKLNKPHFRRSCLKPANSDKQMWEGPNTGA